MKKIIALIALLMVISMLAGCASIEQALHPGETKIAGVWVKDSEIAKYNIKSSAAIDAEIKGDTYCDNCKKVNPGKVRICTYCGQYI